MELTNESPGGFFVLLLGALILTSPIWVVLVFGAFAVGRRQITLLALLIFVTAESIALGAACWTALNWIYVVRE